jgi:hypothetical protein
MSRNRINCLVDVLAYLAMAGLAATGVIVRFRLPAGSGSDAILGLTRHEWGGIHFWIAMALLVLMAIHVALHWTWVTRTFGALFGGGCEREPEAGLGGAVLLVLLGLALAALVAAALALPIQKGSGAGQEGGGRGYRGGRASATEGRNQDAPGMGRSLHERTPNE